MSINAVSQSRSHSLSSFADAPSDQIDLHSSMIIDASLMQQSEAASATSLPSNLLLNTREPTREPTRAPTRAPSPTAHSAMSAPAAEDPEIALIVAEAHRLIEETKPQIAAAATSSPAPLTTQTHDASQEHKTDEAESALIVAEAHQLIAESGPPIAAAAASSPAPLTIQTHDASQEHNPDKPESASPPSPPKTTIIHLNSLAASPTFLDFLNEPPSSQVATHPVPSPAAVTEGNNAPNGEDLSHYTASGGTPPELNPPGLKRKESSSGSPEGVLRTISEEKSAARIDSTTGGPSVHATPLQTQQTLEARVSSAPSGTAEPIRQQSPTSAPASMAPSPRKSPATSPRAAAEMVHIAIQMGQQTEPGPSQYGEADSDDEAEHSSAIKRDAEKKGFFARLCSCFKKK